MSQTSPASQPTSPASTEKPGFWTLAKASLASWLINSPDVAYQVSNITPSTWFSPVQPLNPIAQAPQNQAEGRRWDYMTGYNLQLNPRANEPITFATLRQLADSYDILRLIIENKKDMMCEAKLRFVPNDEVVPKEQQAKYKKDPRIQQLVNFFRKPDGEHTWKQWLRAVLEDIMVIDALTLYPLKTRGGELKALLLMDGGTIKPVIDAYGRTPAPGDVAYQQILKGLPAVDYTRDQIVYSPRNIRSNRVYGYSPVEQIIVTVNIAMRRQLYQLEYYKDGSVPDTIFSMPEGWTPDQLAQFELMWNTMLSGNLAGRRQAKFVPKDTKMINTREAQLKDEYDEWLARVCCFAFGTNPQPFIKMMNRATAQTMKESADEEGSAPWLSTVKDVINQVILNHFGWDDIVAEFMPLAELDPLKRAQADDVDIRNGLKSIDQVLVERNLAPVGMGNAVITQSGVVLLAPYIEGKVTGVPALDDPAPEPGASESGQNGPEASGDGKTAPKGGKKPAKGTKKPSDNVKTAKKFQKAAALLGGVAWEE